MPPAMRRNRGRAALPEFAGNCAMRDDDNGIRLYEADCLDFMEQLLAQPGGQPGGIFDMIFADPPYFLSNGGITCHAGKMVKVHKGDWDKSRGADLNHEFNLAWLSLCQRLLKDHGTIWVSGTHHVIHSVGFAMQQLDMKILNDITWQKPNPPPNLSCRYFTHATETIIWARKGEKSKHKFNYRAMKAENGGKQMKSVWTITAPTRDEKIHGKHPTQKPLDLLTRIIEASTDPGDLIFDPFAGSSTTGIAALHLGRHFIGCETDPNHITLSKRRLQDALTPTQPTLQAATN